LTVTLATSATDPSHHPPARVNSLSGSSTHPMESGLRNEIVILSHRQVDVSWPVTALALTLAAHEAAALLSDAPITRFDLRSGPAASPPFTKPRCTLLLPEMMLTPIAEGPMAMTGSCIYRQVS
jgi:hypothetical protein